MLQVFCISLCGKEISYLFMSLGTSEQFQFYVIKVNACSNSLKISSTIPDLDGVNKNSNYTHSNQLVDTAKPGKSGNFPTWFPVDTAFTNY